MIINHHISDPHLVVDGHTFHNETLNLRNTGSLYGRFIFTEHSGVVISNNVFRFDSYEQAEAFIDLGYDSTKQRINGRKIELEQQQHGIRWRFAQ